MAFFKKVVLFGDSLGKGVIWCPERRRYTNAPETAAATVAARLGIEIINRSRFGYTVTQGFALMELEFERNPRYDAAAIEFGGNDCNFDWAAISAAPTGAHQPQTPLGQFEATLRRMVEFVRIRGVEPFLLTLPPIDAEKYFAFLVGDRLNAGNILRWLGDKQRIYRFQELYSQVVARVARQMQCTLIDLRERCLREPAMFRMLCDDGLHLTCEGQRYVGAQIAGILLQRT